MISFVIPTLNEEKRLQSLLNSLKHQTKRGFEIIVVDSSSKDKTVAIAKIFGCRVINTPKGVAISRNIGGSSAKGDILVFLDADTIVEDKNFVKKILETQVALGILVLKPDKNTLGNKIMFSVFGHINTFLIRKFPALAVYTCNLAVKKSVFKKIRGFNANMHLSEDRDFVLRASKYAKPHVIESDISVSTRRIEKWGTFNFLMYHLASHVYYTVFRKPMPLEYGGVR